MSARWKRLGGVLVLLVLALLTLGAAPSAPCPRVRFAPEAAARGQRLFQSKACVVCHRLDGRALVGPPLDGVAGSRVMLRTGALVCVDERYLRSSLLQPESARVAGFDQQMTQLDLTPREVDDLVAFLASVPPHPLPVARSMTDPFVARGRAIFERGACASCHGAEGLEPVPNPGAADLTVPQLHGLAERLFIGGPVEAKAAIALLEKGAPPRAIRGAATPVGYRQFLAQYRAVHAKIANGSSPAPAYPGVMRPPLEMPAWRSVLTPRDIDAVIAYLISLQDWKE